MDGVLIDGKRFVPMSAILEINMETKTLWFRNYDDQYAERCWNTSFETCQATRLSVSAEIFDFHHYGIKAQK